MSAIFEWVPQPGALGSFEWLSSSFEWIEAEPEFEAGAHATQRAAVVAGFKETFGRDPSLREAQFAQAVQCLETRYGSWRGMCEKYGPEICCGGVGSFNYGSQHAGMPPCNPDTSFECVDRDEHGVLYHVCFKRYPSAAAGAADQIRILYKQRPRVLAAASGSIKGFAETMRATTYFVAPSDKYAEGLEGCLKSITKALGETMPEFESEGGGTSGTKLLLWAGVAAAAGYAAYRFLPGVRAFVTA